MSSAVPIYTIGYGPHSAEKVLTTLQQHNIAFLIDIRSTPSSLAHPDFDQPALTARAKAAGLRYLFMGEQLGEKPKEASCYDQFGQVDYEVVGQQASFLAGIGRIEKAFQQGRSVALLSSEAAPEVSHRSQLIGEALAKRQIPVVHIDEDGSLQPHAAIMQRPRYTDMPSMLTESPPLDDFPSPEIMELAAEAMHALFGGYEDPAGDNTPSIKTTPTEKGNVLGTLKRVFGYDSFRPNQARVIDNILAKKDSLVIMPTGGGKSLCYQLPALHMDGLTVVVSPLISLMQDQVTQLLGLGVPATFLNSSLMSHEYQTRIREIEGGQTKLLYMAPESLLRSSILQMLGRVNVACLTIDEAHCISSWGHDFRPEYRRLVEVRHQFPNAVCVALTATATPRVREDIQRSLQIRKGNQFLSSFDRPNLRINVRPRESELLQVVEFVSDHQGQSGIIYCSTRKRVNKIASMLSERGVNCLPYHGGMDSRMRAKNQDLFIRDDVPIIVATIAFGMGINKPNVRWVLHVNLPKNVESYYQEIGRAGRDGLPSDCLLLFSYQDITLQRRFIEQGNLDEARGRLNRLQALTRWAESGKCRRIGLLGYFGEEITASCNNCDNCLREPVAGEDITILAQKFLSTVIRVRQRFSLTHVVKVLRGSMAQAVIKWQHDQLSTHGIGRDLSEKEWKHIGRQLIANDYLEQQGEYSQLAVTMRGRAVLKGEKVIGTRLAKKARARVKVIETRDYDQVLFQTLRNLRKVLADAANVPPYAVFSDKSLAEMAIYYPHSIASFGRISGVGQKKLAQYAEEFLPPIINHCEANNLMEHPQLSERREQVRKERGVSARSQDVTEQYVAGATIDQLQHKYNVKRQTIISHLSNMVKAGESLPVERLRSESRLSADVQNRVLAAFADKGAQALRPLHDYFRNRVSYEELHLLRVIFWARHGVKSAEPAPNQAEERLFEQLRALTAKIAQEKAVAPFTIFSTRTLRAIVTHMPRTLADFERVDGVGRQRTTKYGKQYTELITAYVMRQRG
ncbi:MAG: DNA helicase RecQ [Candidatus Promineifilaceae bacterium]